MTRFGPSSAAPAARRATLWRAPAFLWRAAALILALHAPPAFAEGSGSDAPESEASGDESFGDAVSRILLKAVSTPFGSTDLEGPCKEPASKEPVSQDVLEIFARSLDGAWSRPSGKAAEETPSIMLEVCLGEDGRTLRRPFLVEPSGTLEPIEAAALIKALEAVEKVAPLTADAEDAKRWRRILVLFDPLSGSSSKPDASGATSGASGAQ